MNFCVRVKCNRILLGNVQLLCSHPCVQTSQFNVIVYHRYAGNVHVSTKECFDSLA